MTRQHSYWLLFSAVFTKDVKLAFRQRAEIVNPILFFLIVISLFPLAIGPEPGLLARMAPGIIWVAALLSTMLGLDKLFRDDFNDGSLEQLSVALPGPGSLSTKAFLDKDKFNAIARCQIKKLLDIILTLDLF